MKKCEYCQKEHDTKWKYCSNSCVLEAQNRARQERSIQAMERETYLTELRWELLPPTEAWIIKIDEKKGIIT
jgi:hypothetical protein